jgi:CheY-like chemotaxis protein
MKESKYKSVLLVDDSYVDNLINRKIMENNNFAEQITVLQSPNEAIDYLKKHLSGSEGIPDAIFLDIRMPEMNGFDFLQKLYLLDGFSDSKIKIYMLSSSLDPGDQRRIKENELVKTFISKPLTSKALQEIE